MNPLKCFPVRIIIALLSLALFWPTDTSLAQIWAAIESTSYNWQDGTWAVTGRILYQNDLEGNQTERLSQNPTESGWVNRRRVARYYDARFNFIEEIAYDWVNGEWVPDWHWLLEYDERDLRIHETMQNFVDAAWVTYEQRISTYDDEGLLEQRLTQSWTDSAWSDKQLETFDYDENGFRTEFVRMRWDDGAWVNSQRWVYSNNAAGLSVERHDFVWEDDSWKMIGRGLNEYDDDEHPLSILNQKGDTTAFTNNWRLLYTYDEQGNQTEYVRQVWTDGDWVNSLRAVYVFSLITATGDNPDELARKSAIRSVYPNPTMGRVTIEYTVKRESSVSVSLHDALGRRVKRLEFGHRAPGRYTATIDGRDLPTGVYFCRLVTSSTLRTTTVVLAK